MRIRFTKMQGAGNDFVVLDETRQRLGLSAEQYRQLADRHFGVGADQILTVRPSPAPGIDFEYVIHNADGGEVEQCGNGARCFARFVIDKRLTAKKRIRVETKNSVIELNVRSDGQITVDMGAPRLLPAEIPFVAPEAALAYEVEVGGQTVELAAVSMGNPHGVLRVDNVDTAPVHTLGPQLETHPRFPQKANIGFLQVVDAHHARLRVWERGCGETQACGTGACAAAVAGIRQGWLESPVQISLPGGSLSIEWAGPGQPVMMTGPALRVFEGQVRL
jgi:diaminopimelate epimerase